MNIGIHASLSVLVSSGCPPSSGIARLYGSSIPSFLRNLHTALIPAFPRSKHLSISWLQSPSTVILEPKKIKFVWTRRFVVSLYFSVCLNDLRNIKVQVVAKIYIYFKTDNTVCPLIKKSFSWTFIWIEPLLFPLQSPCLKKEMSIFLLFLSSVSLQPRNNPPASGPHSLMKLTLAKITPGSW